jgi:hypothetical protein
MTLAATELFDYFSHHPTMRIQREVFACAPFARTRRALRHIVEELQDLHEDDARELSTTLQVALLEWLTTPKPFEADVHETLSSLGGSSRIEGRWGRRVADYIEEALLSIEALISADNPLRVAVTQSMAALRLEGRTFRVYCHRTAIDHFQAALREAGMAPIDAAHFLHSVVDYRESDLFDVLIKVGPLRARGWGAAPDAILTAPRFTELRLFVWNGSTDEPSFGYDPVSPRTSSHDGMPWYERDNNFHVVSTTVRHGDDDGPHDERERPSVDEISLFREMGKRDGMRRAMFVTLDGGHGVLLTPNAPVIALARQNGEARLERGAAADVLVRGAFLVRPMLGEVDLGGTHAELGYFSREWKARLAEMAREDGEGLVARLRKAGVGLVRLSDAIEHWIRPPTTVIHSPQQVRHFKILIEVLGLSNRSEPQGRGRSWWQLAWDEISRSRGVAIRDGVIEHELLETQCIGALEAYMEEIRACAHADGSFRFGIPPGGAISGTVMFNRVEAIEDGFLAPEAELRMLRDAREADQWRA